MPSLSSYQITVRKISENEFSENNQFAFESLKETERNFGNVEFFKVTPEIPINITTKAETSKLFLWNQITQRWTPVELNQKTFLIKNTRSGLLLHNYGHDSDVAIIISTVGIIISFLIIGSALMMLRRPEEINSLLQRN